MKSELQLLKEANDILRSVNSIVDREGKETNWEGISKVVKMALAEQHELLLAKNCYIAGVVGRSEQCAHDYAEIHSSVHYLECRKCGDVLI